MRNATLYETDLVTLERAIYELARHNAYEAWKLGALALRLREQTGLRGEAFECNVDESAGMAEPQSLDAWRESRCIK